MQKNTKKCNEFWGFPTPTSPLGVPQIVLYKHD